MTKATPILPFAGGVSLPAPFAPAATVCGAEPDWPAAETTPDAAAPSPSAAELLMKSLRLIVKVSFGSEWLQF
jgi:hypothetical protein